MNDFSLFFKHNPVPTFLWKKDKMENCNPAAVKFFGAKTEKELISQDIFKRIDSKVFYGVLNKTSRDNHSTADLPISKHRGKFTINASKLAEEEGYLIRIDKIDKLAKSPPSENRFQTIVESSHDAIMRFDRQHRHLYVNSVVEEQTKIPVADFIGKTHDELGFPKHLCELWEDALDKVFESGDYHRVEFTLPNDIHIDWSLVPELDENGDVGSVITTARDITEIKSAQKGLLQEQTKFKDAFDLAHLANWETDIINSKVVLNPEFCSIVGLPYNENETILDNSIYFNDFVHDSDKEKFLDTLSKGVKSNDESYQDILSYRINRPDGSMIWLLATIRIGINEQGEVQKAYGTCQDITHIKNTEKELEEHRLRLEDLVEERTHALRQSENKLIDAINLAKLSTWEYEVGNESIRIEGLLEKKLDKSLFSDKNYLRIDGFIDAIYPEDYKLFYTAIERSLKTKDKEYYEVRSFRVFDINMDIRHVNLTVKVEINEKGQVSKLYGTIQDFTHIVESRIENERLTSIIEATSDIVAIISPEKDIIYLNKAGTEFYGVNLQKNGKTPLKDVQSETSLKVLKEAWLISETKGYWIGENKIKRHDGVEVHVSQVVIAHHLDNGQLDCYSSIIRDISKQKKTEEDLIYKNNELDTFVYRASHDLRGPIASMLGLYNVVKHEVKDEVAMQFFGMYNNQILRLNEVIVALIDLTRIKEKDTEQVPVNFKEIINGAINSFTHLPRFEKIKFGVKVDFDNEISTDKSLMNTIIQNLIENAIKYSRPDIDPLVNIHVKPMITVGEGLVIKVQDNGIGIEESIQDKIFNMFFRGNNDAIGSGLGLYILKNAVDKLHGRIVLNSRPGKGTVFIIELPFG